MASNSHDNQVEWLLRSTELVLGERDQWINATHVQSSSLPREFASYREYIIQAESVMKSWLKFISKQPSTSLNETSDGRNTPNPVEAAQIIENILKHTLTVFDEWEGSKKEEELSYLTTTRADLLRITIDALVRSNSSTSVESGIHLLRMLQKRQDGKIMTYANEESYHAIIKGCISTRKYNDLEKAVGLLEEMQSTLTICPTHNDEYYDRDDAFSCLEMHLYPSTRIYNLVLYGLAHCKPCLQNAQRAESLLQQMISNHKSNSGYNCYPDSNTFRQVVSSLTKSGSKNAVQNAHRVLNMMLNEFTSVQPDPSTYNAIMTLYLKKGRPEKVLQLFNQILANGRTKPDSYSMNLMLRAKTYEPGKLSLQEIVEIEDVLLRMKAVYNVQPNTQSFNVIIDALAKSGMPDSANRAEALLDAMEKKCRSGDMSAVPDSYTFTSLLNAISLANHHSAKGSWAEHVHRRMKRMNKEGLVEAPTTPVYNALLNALITSNERGAYNRAKSLFAEMVAMTIANTRTYNIMIKSHSTIIEDSGVLISYARPSKAKALLYQMEQSKGIVSPDIYSYTTLMCAYSRSNTKRKAMKAFGVLRKAIDSGVLRKEHHNPKVRMIRPFNAVLTACAHTNARDEKVQAFTILVSTLILIREYTKPDDTTYRVLIKACERLVPTDESRKRQVIDLVSRELEYQSGNSKMHASMLSKFMTMYGGYKTSR
ncbi:hypothetical protein ACHAWO_012268 [Cyclotella atomus]|uniref:Pentacotripeptide-repeat region of PRORP domain-containing protein n=1 Tax=Cyclotella atomus TaxID=382360 RepID=A0ABD3QWN8_9STRA